MKYCKSNNGQTPIIITDNPTAASNISNPTHKDFIAAGWLEYAPCTQANVKTSEWQIISGCYVEVPTDTWTEAELIQREIDRKVDADTRSAQEEQARQLAKSLALRTAENRFLAMCDLLTNSTSHAKLSFAQIETIIKSLPLEQQPLVSIELLAIDAELKREGGLLWWDDCVWHEE